jgi:hydrogenase-4 component B
MITMPDLNTSVIFMSSIFGVGIVLPTLFRRDAWPVNCSLGLACAGSLFAIVLAVLTQKPLQADLATSSWLPDGWNEPAAMLQLRFEVRVDNLSALFMVLIGAFAALVSVYSFAALRAPHYRAQRHRIAAGFNLFVWATLMVVVANDAFSLIVALEAATLAFAFLTLYKHDLYVEEGECDAEKWTNARIAGQVYFFASHISTALIILALLLLILNAGSMSFDRLRDSVVVKKLDATPGLTSTIFLLALAGLGIRAGLTPAHVWVPLAHPASPTTTHAFSLGIAIKVAIYLMVRVFFQFLQPEEWWGYVVLGAGSLTALVNVWYALHSHDLKTALAYHSVENIGIIVAGLGVALINSGPGMSETRRALATLALVASLYHLLNHAVFKGLLYLCTGAIDHLTHQVVEFRWLGGLIKLYPWTSAAFLVGALSICGLPPFNGAVSEWLTLQALLNTAYNLVTPVLTPKLGATFVIFGLTLLMTSFALTLLCFLKIVDLTLLGTPRCDRNAREQWDKRDAPWLMRAPALLLAGLCLILGVMPLGITGPLEKIASDLVGTLPAATFRSPGLQVWIGNHSVAALPIDALLLLSFGLVLLVVLVEWQSRRRMRGRATARPPDAWMGGETFSPAAVRPTGAFLTSLLRDLVPEVPTWIRQRVPEYMPAQFHVSESEQYPQTTTEIFRLMYNAVIAVVLHVSRTVSDTIQNGDISRYLLYILIANLVALVIFLGGVR